MLIVIALPMALWGQALPTDYSAARPWVRWWWNGNKVDTVELRRELRLLHDAGVGGVEINAIEFPAKRCDSLGIKSLTWLSEAWLDALEVALREAKALGMGCDLLVGSGWPFGKETLEMGERAQVMLTYAREVKEGDSILIDSIFTTVDPQVTEKNADRTFELVSAKLTPMTIRSIAEVKDLALGAKAIVVPEDGMLYALVRCRSFASVINGAPGASGPILDHMNALAVRRYLEWMSNTLEGRFGPMKNWLRAYFVDSMELEGANWTDDMAEEFRRRRGYDLMEWLPFTMFKVGRLGNVEKYEYGAVQSPEFKEQVRRVRYDFELTKAELLDERYTQTFLDWCHRQGVKARAQAYGRGFFPLESSLGYDIPEGESWTTNYLRHRIGEEMGDEDYRRGRAYTMINKYVSSAAHQSGRRVVSAEEMTNTYRLFETNLELLKLGSDMSAFSGITHSVWHGFNYSPREAGFPGWVQYGSYYSEQNSWWPYFHLLNEYRARMCYWLQHADMQTDMAIVVPIDDLWADYGVQTEPFPNYPKGSVYEKVQLLWEAVHKNGGNCDLITPQMLKQAKEAADGFHIGNKVYKVCLQLNETGVMIVKPYVPESFVVQYPSNNDFVTFYSGLQKIYQLPHSLTIKKPWPYLLQNHYRNDKGEDIYLLVNCNLDTAYMGQIAFPKEVWNNRHAVVYDCNTGHESLMELREGIQEYFFLGPAESMLIIFCEGTPSQEKGLPIWYPAYNEGTDQSLSPEIAWHVHLQHALLDWQSDTVMTELRDLRATSFRDFSGTITYSAHVQLDAHQAHLTHLDLGPQHDICQVVINGTDLGIKWFGRREYYFPEGLLHEGDNTIEIRITTTLNNYVHTLTDDKVIQHFVLKRNVPTSPIGLIGHEGNVLFD